jgi:hypothetical protein
MIYSINGYLIIGEGSRINICELSQINPSEIKIISYIENKNIPICSKTKLKFIITGDLLQSITWLHFSQDSSHRDKPYIYVKGIDFSEYKSSALEFWIDDSSSEENKENYNYKNGCLLGDNKGNLHIFLMDNEQGKINSQKLIEFADIHIGKVLSEIKYYSYEDKSANFYSALDGSIGFIKPIGKDIYNSLFMLCEFIYNHFPFNAGLNPKSFFRCDYINKKEKSNILDFDLLKLYLDLPVTTQTIIAKNIGLKREDLIRLINKVNNI